MMRQIKEFGAMVKSIKDLTMNSMKIVKLSNPKMFYSVIAICAINLFLNILFIKLKK